MPDQRSRQNRRQPATAGISDGFVPAAALLPLRFFLGGMFLYAGIDKLLDPAFLRSDGPGSIAVQLLEFARVSPLAPLVTLFAEPFPMLVGLGISLLEIAIGLGALLGLLYRWSAVAGAGADGDDARDAGRGRAIEHGGDIGKAAIGEVAVRVNHRCRPAAGARSHRRERVPGRERERRGRS